MSEISEIPKEKTGSIYLPYVGSGLECCLCAYPRIRVGVTKQEPGSEQEN